MDQLETLFLRGILTALKEDISRDEKWHKEDQIFLKIINALKNTKPTDVVSGRSTQAEKFKECNAVVVNIPDENLEVCFAYELLNNQNKNSFASYNSLTKTLYVGLYLFGLAQKNNLSLCILDILTLLQRDDIHAVVHHELAHKLFADNFNDIQKLFKFKLRWMNIDYYKRPEEYNSFLSEIYDYAIKKKNLLFKAEKDVLLFCIDLFSAESPYLNDLGATLAALPDMNKLVRDLIRFSENKKKQNILEIFNKFKDYLIKNKIQLKNVIDLKDYLVLHSDILEVRNMLNLQTSIDKINYNKICGNIIHNIPISELTEIKFIEKGNDKQLLCDDVFLCGCLKVNPTKNIYSLKKRLIDKIEQVLLKKDKDQC